MKLSSFLEDESGGFSATRLAFLLWTVGVLAAWIYQSIQGNDLAKIDNSVITVIGILMTGKVVQRFGEKPESPASNAALPAAISQPTTSQAGE